MLQHLIFPNKIITVEDIKDDVFEGYILSFDVFFDTLKAIWFYDSNHSAMDNVIYFLVHCAY